MFDGNDYWRGPSWVNCNYMVMMGLLRYGQLAVAKELFHKTVAMMEQNRGPMQFDEGYNPATGQAVRQGQFSWSTLVVSMDSALRKYEQSGQV